MWMHMPGWPMPIVWRKALAHAADADAVPGTVRRGGALPPRTRFSPGPPRGARSAAKDSNAMHVTTRAQVKYPCILANFDEFAGRLRGKRLAVFLDYDGRSGHVGAWMCGWNGASGEALAQRGKPSPGASWKIRTGPTWAWGVARGALLGLGESCTRKPLVGGHSRGGPGLRLAFQSFPISRCAGTLTPIVSNPDAALISQQVHTPRIGALPCGMGRETP